MASLRPTAAAAALTSTQLAGRAVHIKIHPRPRNLDESREVLRVLQKYGEVVMFKNLRHEFQAPAPNTILAIYQHASSASNLVAASPLRYGLESESVGDDTVEFPGGYEDGAIDTVSSNIGTSPETDPGSKTFEEDEPSHKEREESPTQSPSPSHSRSRNPPTTTPTTLAPPQQPSIKYTRPTPTATTNAPNTFTLRRLREFQLTADISHYNHKAYIERQPHYGGFFPDTKSSDAEDLASSVPMVGLSNLYLRKAEVPMRIVHGRAQELKGRKTLREIWEGGVRRV